MEKIIIHIEDYDAMTALEMVRLVINQGKISKTANREHYCHCVTFKNDGIVSSVNRKENTNTFYVRNYIKEQERYKNNDPK